MTFILALDLLEGNYGALKAVEGKQSSSGGNVPGNAGILHDDRPTGCQIAGATVAEPASSASRIAWLDSCKFSARTKDVDAVAVGVCDVIRRRGKSPTVLLKL